MGCTQIGKKKKWWKDIGSKILIAIGTEKDTKDGKAVVVAGRKKWVGF